MDKKELIEATLPKTGGGISADAVETVIDALFGTVETPGSIAEAVKAGEHVTLLGFGGFEPAEGDPSSAVRLRPGKALVAFMHSN
ncbi:HU family DNA-binding protein [Streptomyces montanisoli]|uniref:HU family DNA-binding protein n=1 Tax=Streptomyces montanisoli TaxID=2798581 RepID=A0A940MCJ2_9ACTN|nr:HU family DNA-binding protein [Streptomyces montanisoli]MBP0457137.1 HU family DNA-binding protein [Streptomyces montanisoli]